MSTLFNLEGEGAHLNARLHNAIRLCTRVDVTTCPSIESPNKIATSYSIGVISSCLRWNVCISRIYCSISAWIKSWSNLMAHIVYHIRVLQGAIELSILHSNPFRRLSLLIKLWFSFIFIFIFFLKEKGWFLGKPDIGLWHPIYKEKYAEILTKTLVEDKSILKD